MNTLIIPCAGRSSRFENMRPKWLLTHPDGLLMLQKAITGFDVSCFDRIIVTIVREHAEKFEAEKILKQAFKNVHTIEICILDEFTHSASETIYLTLHKMAVTGPFVVKDSDNFISFDLPCKLSNAVVGYDISTHKNVSNITAKSFLTINEQNIIQDIIEKQVVSSYICLGVYIFADTDKFCTVYENMINMDFKGEMYLSHIISFMIASQNELFEVIFANNYEDWGTFTEWRAVQQRYAAYFVDVDGVLLKNSGQYGTVNWDNNTTYLDENISLIRELQDQGGQIIICTSRTEAYRSALESLLANVKIFPHAVVMGVNHAPRIMVNDFAPTNPYPSAVAISLPRNNRLRDWLNR